MSDTNSNNLRLECPFCKISFLTKSFSKHLNDTHLPEIFVSKVNKQEVDDACKRKEGSFFNPLELKLKDKEMYYVSCCKKFYSKKSMAQKHSKSKECRDVFLKNTQELSEKLTPINVSNNHSGSGDINNNTTIINNYNIYDLSGNIVKTFKEVIQNLDDEKKEKSRYYKKYAKLKKFMEENDIDYDSDVSTVQSYYADDECETNEDYFKKAERYDLTKELSKKDILPFIKAGIDLSREGLGLKTKEEHDNEIKEKKQYEIENVEDKITDCKDVIYDCKETIDDLEHRIRDFDNDDKESKSYCQKLILEAQKRLDKARREKEKYQEELLKLRGK